MYLSGIVPRTCKELFMQIESKKKAQPEVSYEVTFSMMEIYNEQVRDLLNKKKTPTGGLKIKEAPVKGFYGKVGCVLFNDTWSQ